MSLEIVLSIAAAFFVGTSDFFAKLRPSNRHITNSLLAMSLLGSSFFALYAIWGGHNILFFDNWQTTGLLIVSGITNILALLCLYLGLARGPVSVAAPLVAMSSVFLAFKWYLAGVTISGVGYLGGIIAVAGAIILGLRFKSDVFSLKHILITAGFALLAGFFFSTRLYLMQLISEDIHHSIVLTQARLFGLIFTLAIIGYYTFIKHQKVLPSKHDFNFKYDLVFPTIQAGIGAAGLICLLIASVNEYRVIAPAIFCLNSGFTVLFSCIFFKEKVTFQRILGFIILIFGIILLKLN